MKGFNADKASVRHSTRRILSSVASIADQIAVIDQKGDLALKSLYINA